MIDVLSEHDGTQRPRGQPGSVTVKYIRVSPAARPRLPHSAVFRALLKSQEGLDRLAAAVQFTLRLYVCLSGTRVPKRNRNEERVAVTLLLVSILSTARKIISSLAFVEPLKNAFLAVTPRISASSASLCPSHLAVLTYILDAIAGIMDDIECLGRLRLFGVGERARVLAGRIGDLLAIGTSILRLTMARQVSSTENSKHRHTHAQLVARTTDVSVIEDSNIGTPLRQAGPPSGWDGLVSDWEALPESAREVEEEQWRARIVASVKQSRIALDELWWSKVCWAGEGIFAAYDALKIERGSEGVRAVLGFVSAAIRLRETIVEVHRELQ